MRKFVGLAAAMVAALAVGQPPVTPVSPLAPPPAASTGSLTVLLAAAQRAQDLGLPSIAAELYRQTRDMPGADRAEITMALVTALLDAGDAAEAERLLAEVPEPRGAAWHLRRGLAAFHLRNRAVAQAEWDAIVGEEVPLADKPWYWFLGGALYDTATPRDERRANQFYSNAELAATTELARAYFQLAGERVRLRMLQRPTAVELNTALENHRVNQGTEIGYRFAKHAAVVMSELGQRREAVEFLSRVLATIPAPERRVRDDLRLWVGVLGDRTRNGPGRAALVQLVETGQNPERQRQALQLLAAASTRGDERADFRRLLTRLAEAKPDHPIKETVLYFRAQFALSDRDYPAAERDAEAIHKEFPQSRLKVHAFGLLAQSAWEQRRYRSAATFAGRARAELSAAAVAPAAPPVFPPRARADLGVLEAEAHFRAGDYRSAADAYAGVLREQRAELEPGKIGGLMFQRVLAEIRAGGDAAKVLDELARDPTFDRENRWQAEWHLARELQTRGPAAIHQALGRVTALLDAPAPEGAALAPELRARMAWLQARLCLDSGDAEQAVRRAEALLAAPLEIAPRLKDEIASMTVLIRARAEFALGREAAALETLKRLRETYAKTEAAVSSYLIESEYYEGRENLDEAQKTLVKLIDHEAYKKSDYVPDALYRLALLSERLGGEQNLHEANRRIEDLITIEEEGGRSRSPLVFRARLEQGHVFRKLNDFPAAQRAYEEAANKFSQRPDVVYALLALAECHNAQSAAEGEKHVHADTAERLFEQLRDRFDAPLDVRVEAGYNLGKLLERRGKLQEAAKVWWADVVKPFLLEDTDPMRHAAKRPYWLARTLADVGDLLQRLERFEDAKRAYLLLLKSGLPNGEAVARVRLQALGVPAAKAGQ